MDRISIITLALAKKFTKDTVAALEQVVRYIGVTTTAISDGSTTNPITIKGQSVTAVAGDTVFYNGTSYAWDGNAWQEVMNIAEIITAVEALGGRVHDILGDIAPEFNSASAYAVDDVVLYEDDLYIFTNAHTGAWDSSDVAVTSIAQLVDDLRAEIASTNERVSALETHVTQSGDVIDSDNHSLHIVGEAIETEKTVSGNPITVTDALPYNAVSVSAEIEAEQDLHGQSAPYVGGAGKNKLPMTVSGIKALNTVGTWSGNIYTWNGNTFEILTDSANNVLGIKVGGTNNGTACRFQVCNEGFIGDGSYYLNGSSTEFSGGQTQLYTKYSATNYAVSYNGADTPFTVSGGYTIGSVYILVDANISFSSPITYKPMIRLSTESDASYAPYSNICPISGRTEESVLDHGKNFLALKLTDIKALNTQGTWVDNAYTYDNVTYTCYTENDFVTEIKVNASAATTAQRDFVIYRDFDNSCPYNSYVLNGCPSNGSSSTFDLRVSDITTRSSADVGSGVTINLSDTGKWQATITIRSGQTPSNVVYKPMIRPSGTSADFEPYKSSSVTIQLGQTVYGGTLNVTTGKLTITDVIGDGTVETIEDSYTNVCYGTLAKPNDSADKGTSIKHDTITNMFKVVNAPDSGDGWDSTNNIGKLFCAASANRYWICFPKGKTLSDLQTITADTKICYKLATPTTIQLTPTDLQMLKGYNRLSCDGGGDITLTYRANKADSVQAEVDVLETTKADNADVVDYIENGNTASRAYTANQFMLWKGDLYKVTTSIASGATITAGTNVSKTTISAVLTALLNA